MKFKKNKNGCFLFWWWWGHNFYCLKLRRWTLHDGTCHSKKIYSFSVWLVRIYSPWCSFKTDWCIPYLFFFSFLFFSFFFLLNSVVLWKIKFFSPTSLKRNSTNFLYISILNVNFENLTVRLYVLIIFFMHVKFQEDQRSIAISSNKC